MMLYFSNNISFYKEFYNFDIFLAPGGASGGAKPSRAEPGRAEPSRAEPGRAEPSHAEPSRARPSRAEPSRAGPSRPLAEPRRAEPSRAVPSRAGPAHPPGPNEPMSLLNVRARLAQKLKTVFKDISLGSFSNSD